MVEEMTAVQQQEELTTHIDLSQEKTPAEHDAGDVTSLLQNQQETDAELEHVVLLCRD